MEIEAQYLLPADSQPAAEGTSAGVMPPACRSVADLKYVVITPVKDEERYMEHTLKSMVRQSLKPLCWIIVDDGSSDRTPEILKGYKQEHRFIKVVTSRRGGIRQPGPAVIHAFNRGCEAAGGLDYDFIVKLDCDLSFESDYFERLLGEMLADPKLGIASGVYLESADGSAWSEVVMPPYHAAGASKVIRRDCFEQIGGFITSRGWDTVDEVRAMVRGWRTAHFSKLKLKHWKPEGAGIGALRTNFMHGEIYYLTGGGMLFLVLKILRRMGSRPFLIAGMALFWGYLRTRFSAKARLVTEDEARCYRALLNGRLAGAMKRLFQIA